MTVQGMQQKSQLPPSPVGHSMQPCLWPLTMPEVEVVMVDVVLPGIVGMIEKGRFSGFLTWLHKLKGSEL